MPNKMSPVSLHSKEQIMEMTPVNINYSVHPVEILQVSCVLQNVKTAQIHQIFFLLHFSRKKKSSIWTMHLSWKYSFVLI